MTYLSHDQGGYNLSELEMVYKLSKIKIAHHIATSTDQRIKLVREFQDWKEHRGFTSANKVAQRYAYDLGVEIEFNNPLEHNRAPDILMLLNQTNPRY